MLGLAMLHTALAVTAFLLVASAHVGGPSRPHNDAALSVVFMVLLAIGFTWFSPTAGVVALLATVGYASLSRALVPRLIRSTGRVREAA